MKLFLASSLNKTFKLFLEKVDFNGKRPTVLFIANASDNHKGDTWWINLDRDTFVNNGFDVKEIDLRQINKEEFAEKLKKTDILHFCGGSVLYLLDLLKRKEMAQIVYAFVKENRVIYTSTSAGSMIVASDVTLSKYDDEEKNFIENNITDFTGIGLVDFFIIPHCQQEIFLQSNKDMLNGLPLNTHPVILLNDNHAVWVDNEKLEFLTV